MKPSRLPNLPRGVAVIGGRIPLRRRAARALSALAERIQQLAASLCR